MPDRLTIRLPEDLSQALEAASIRLRRKRSDIVRLALYSFFSLTPANDDTPSARVQHLLGALDSGVPGREPSYLHPGGSVSRFGRPC
ncbi:MAG TPA: CopG family transcriptional regulator [Thermoanaerobaculia bacterium]|jgi:hypothetical protein|nr:CopG family transcriptional regulator [Thermoanaerobaculia bacterium]